MKKVAVFTGTSISHEDAKAILNADYFPPVARGDLEKIRGYDIVGIIDGVFFNRAAVAHKEILGVMDRGITVVGGCSMGALRAAELDVHGMIGVGKVYAWYRDGVIESDDEVAVITNPETYEAVSAPLVNIRETFKAAAEAGIINETALASLLKIAQQLHYPRRNYFRIIDEALSAGILTHTSKLKQFCKENEVDVKREDAIAVLKKICGLIASEECEL